MKGLTTGSIVHYIIPSGRSKGEHRPAIVVRDWSNSDVTSYPDGTVNLQVFTDSLNDYPAGIQGSNGSMWATSVHYSEGKEPGTWHLMEKE